MNKTLVYFIQDPATGLIKIGKTKNLFQRFKTLQSAIPSELKILGVTDAGDDEDEKSLHYYFRKSKVRGEWYKPDKKLLHYIKSRTGVAWAYSEKLRKQYFEQIHKDVYDS